MENRQGEGKNSVAKDMNYRGEDVGGGVGRMEWSEGGRKWDNCNSIINKYIFKNRKKSLKRNHTQKKFIFQHHNILLCI